MHDNLFHDNVLIFDGGIGTTLYDQGFYINRPFEELNLSAPDAVKSMHEAFANAGADCLTTNTFSATKLQLNRFDIADKQKAIIEAAIEIAATVAKEHNKKVSMSLGPLGELLEPLGRISKRQAMEDFYEAASIGVATELIDFIFLETFTNMRELNAAITGIRNASDTIPIIASVSIKSSQDALLEAFLLQYGSSKDLAAVGFNCSEGPSDLLTVLKRSVDYVTLPIVVRPNAGVPKQINGRYFYMTSPDYLGKFAKRFVEAGASGVGGCCGTGPEHIAAIRRAIGMSGAQKKATAKMKLNAEVRQKELLSLESRSLSKVAKKLCAGEKIVSIEINPPKGNDLESFIEKVKLVEAAGVEFVNVPDNARASTRISSLHVATAVAHNNMLSTTIIPHFTARDRNLIALQSDLLGASANGVNDVLLVTGDPPKLGNNKEATGIYDVDSIGMVHLTDCLNKGMSPAGETLQSNTGFGIGVASNPTAINLALEKERWQYKVEMGADYAITQPVFNVNAYKRWLDEISSFHRPQVVGIWPLISLRNAEFLANEVPGISVPKNIIEQFERITSKEDGMKLGLEIASNIMNELNNICAGFCISAPLGKVKVALQLVAS